MSDLFAFLTQAVVLVPTLVIAIVITAAAVRGSRNRYVVSPSLVLEEFLINPSAAGEPAIRVVGRHKGLVAWIMTNLGMETRVELTVTDKEWILRQGSLAGMLVTNVPLKKINQTICGYQQSMLAFFLAVFFGLNGVGSLLPVLPLWAKAAQNGTEYSWEVAAKSIGSDLYGALLWFLACGIAVVAFHASKRASFAVEAGERSGIVFGRSFIGNQVIEMDMAERGMALLNRMALAATDDIPLDQIPQAPASALVAHGNRALRGWMVVTGYMCLFLLAFALSWYGDGVTLNVATTPPGSSVFLDNQYFGTTNEGGLLIIRHTLRQKHVLQFQCEGYQPLSAPVELNKFESMHRVSVKMVLLNYPVTVTTTPPSSHVTLDGQEVGTSNDQGYLVIPKVDRGTHQIAVSHDGYRTFSRNIDVLDRRSYQIDLVSEAEAAQQEAAARQNEIAGHFDQARMLYQQGQLQAALDECDSALKIDPSNAVVLALKKQIEQTRKIMGQ